jgi:protein-S-isoprenylcysteine O-methyltransferase Ste14
MPSAAWQRLSPPHSRLRDPTCWRKGGNDLVPSGTGAYRSPLYQSTMAPLREQFEQSGNWLFRWRSYLPALFLALLFIGMRDFRYLGGRHEYQEAWAAGCLTLSLVGLAIRIVVVGYAPPRTSGRNTVEQVADQLNTTGMYSVVRHPLYLGNFLIWLGIASFCLIWWLLIVYVLMFCVYYERIMFAEEEFLRRRFGQPFLDWAAATPTFLPRWSHWRAPEQAFDVRKVLRREYPAAVGILAAFAVLELSVHLVVERRWRFDLPWDVALLVAVLLAAALRTLKRHTRLLKPAVE